MQNLPAKEAKSEDYIFQLSEELADMQQQNEDITTELKVYCFTLMHSFLFHVFDPSFDILLPKYSVSKMEICEN